MHSLRAAVISKSLERFQAAFGGSPSVVSSAPGRVNLIGEHTDYNDGFVLPIAVHPSIAVAARARHDRQLFIRSETDDETVKASLDDPRRDSRQPWSNYITGVAHLLQRKGNPLKGADLFVMGDIPEGAGLSSSAALEVATAYTLRSLNEIPIADLEIVKLCQQAEHEFAGIRCGIMDQFVCALAREDHALFVDCRTLEFEHVPFPAGVTPVLCYTGVKRELARSEYNLRREECSEAVTVLSRFIPGLRALRDLSYPDFKNHQTRLSPLLQKRCRHVVSENGRVLEAVESLKRRDLSNFGRLMYESHLSLKSDYEVSSPELDTVVDICAESNGVFGARMTGAGFGGSAICLVENEQVKEVVERLSKEYPEKTGRTPLVIDCTVESGVVVRNI